MEESFVCASDSVLSSPDTSPLITGEQPGLLHCYHAGNRKVWEILLYFRVGKSEESITHPQSSLIKAHLVYVLF